MGILSGVAEIEDRWLGLTSKDREDQGQGGYKKTTANKLSAQPVNLSADKTFKAFKAICEKINANHLGYKSACQNYQPSKENWRWDSQLYIDSKNKSSEKILEKSMAFFLSSNQVANQVPVCSGLASPNEGSRALDLVFDRGNEKLEFIELKCGPRPDNPLYAAMELLEYGLIYVWSRKSDLLPQGKFRSAKNVNLIVLAPSHSFHGRNGFIDLSWLSEEISNGLNAYLERIDLSGLSLSFRFEQFSNEFQEKYQQLAEAREGFCSLSYPFGVTPNH